MLYMVWDTWTRWLTLEESIISQCQAQRDMKDLSAPRSCNSTAFIKPWELDSSELCEQSNSGARLPPALSQWGSSTCKAHFMHTSIWHTGLSCLGLSYIPGQLLLKTQNPISRPDFRKHMLPLLRMELSQHLVTVLNHNFETLFVYYI